MESKDVWYWRINGKYVDFENEVVTVKIPARTIEEIAEKIKSLEKEKNRAVRNLDGKVVEVLGHRELRTDRGIISIANWFWEEYRDKLEKLKDCKIGAETDRAILLQNDNAQIWVPRSLITWEEMRK